MTANQTARRALQADPISSALDRMIDQESDEIGGRKGLSAQVDYLKDIIYRLTEMIPKEQIPDMPFNLDIYRR